MKAKDALVLIAKVVVKLFSLIGNTLGFAEAHMLTAKTRTSCSDLLRSVCT